MKDARFILIEDIILNEEKQLRKINLPDNLKVDIKFSFNQFGEFTYKEIQFKRKTKKPTKEPAAIYVFPKSTAAIAEL